QARPRVTRLHLAAQHLRVGGEAGQRRVDTAGNARREQADRRHLFRVLELLLEPDAGGDVVDDEDCAPTLPVPDLERGYRHVHHKAATVVGGEVELVDVGDL